MDWLPLLAAPFIGSLVGVLVRRLPDQRPVLVARSACDACGRALAPWDLVPLLSFAVLRGRCRSCMARIGWFHPAIEAAALLVAVWASLADPAQVWVNCALGWTLLALGWIDWERMRLPDALTLPLLLAGLGVAWSEDAALASGHALAAATGYLLFRGVALAYRRLRGRDGLGAGDAKLLAAAGAWVGLDGLPAVMLVGAALGIGLALVRPGVTMATRVPFGPALALALWLVRLHGSPALILP